MSDRLIVRSITDIPYSVSEHVVLQILSGIAPNVSH
jgi:hypothetical protein